MLLINYDDDCGDFKTPLKDSLQCSFCFTNVVLFFSNQLLIFSSCVVELYNTQPLTFIMVGDALSTLLMRHVDQFIMARRVASVLVDSVNKFSSEQSHVLKTKHYTSHFYFHASKLIIKPRSI